VRHPDFNAQDYPGTIIATPAAGSLIFGQAVWRITASN
jgi:hypothetical protein